VDGHTSDATRSPTLIWIGRAALLAVTARSLVSLIDDIDLVL
jgi:hypothetical protein